VSRIYLRFHKSISICMTISHTNRRWWNNTKNWGWT